MNNIFRNCHLRDRSIFAALTSRSQYIKSTNVRLLSTNPSTTYQYLMLHSRHKIKVFQSDLPHLNNTFKPSSRICCVTRPYANTSKDTTKNDEPQEEEKKLSLFQKFKQMYRDYWYVLIPVHLATSAVWVVGFYYLAKSGVDVVAVLESMNASERIIGLVKNSSTGYVAITYALYKIATPARYAVTVGGTTLSINYLKKWGYIRPIPPKEKLKEMYQEKRDNIKDNLKEKKDSFVDNFFKSGKKD